MPPLTLASVLPSGQQSLPFTNKINLMSFIGRQDGDLPVYSIPNMYDIFPA